MICAVLLIAYHVPERSRHIFSASLGTPRADGSRQVRLACAKPQTSREVDQDPEGGLTRQCNTRPSFLIICCVWESFSQDDGLLLPQAARDGQALCHLSRQISRIYHPKAGSQGQARATCTSNLSHACLPSRAGSKRTLPHRGGGVFVLVSHSHHKTSRLCVETRVPSTMSARWTASMATPSMRCQSQRMRTRRASSDEGTFHYVNFPRDPVRGARICRHLHRALSSDRVRGAHTCCLYADSD